jgi:protein-L-isoaspartate(D-aspartate) O-methyltransferase
MNDMSAARTNMVYSQVATNKVADKRILAAMLDIPRERFLPASQQAAAYIDQDVIIDEQNEDGPERYLMEPMPFARLLQAADILPTDDVLDIGCGTGYSAAIIGNLADSVIALESHGKLADTAAENLSELSIDNAVVITGPLVKGYPDEGPYDVIIVEGAVDFVPGAIFDQLKEGGRLAAIVNEGRIGRATVFSKTVASVSRRIFFDANVRCLPGFEAGREFVF